MKAKIAITLAVVAVGLTGCMGGSSDPLQEIAGADNNYVQTGTNLDTREDAVEAANEALEWLNISKTEDNRERVAELSLEAAQEDPDKSGVNIIVCLSGNPPYPPENLTGWERAENKAAACADR